MTPDGYNEQARIQVIEPSNTTNAGGTRPEVWNHPAFARSTTPYVLKHNRLIAADLDANSYR